MDAEAGRDKDTLQHAKIIGEDIQFFWHPTLTSMVDKDVARTDRGHVFYTGDDNPSLKALRDILLTHTVLDPELGNREC